MPSARHRWPYIDEYMKQWRNAKVVPPGSLKIDGRTLNCGKRPTVLNSYFDSWGGAFPASSFSIPRRSTGFHGGEALRLFT
jgi:hypothetical protein